MLRSIHLKTYLNGYVKQRHRYSVSILNVNFLEIVIRLINLTFQLKYHTYPIIIYLYRERTERDFAIIFVMLMDDIANSTAYCSQSHSIILVFLNNFMRAVGGYADCIYLWINRQKIFRLFFYSSKYIWLNTYNHQVLQRQGTFRLFHCR